MEEGKGIILGVAHDRTKTSHIPSSYILTCNQSCNTND